MRKKLTSGLLILGLTVTAGCGKEDLAMDPTAVKISEEAAGEDSPGGTASGEGSGEKGPQRLDGLEEPSSADSGAEEGFRLEDLSDWTFYFSSGVGAWFTDLQIDDDGTFRGHYQDADMGDVGEDYPNGTLYLCDFTGRFEDLEKVDAFTYKMRLASISLEEEEGKEEIVDGVRQIYSVAYGLEGGEEFRVFLPGSKVSDLPEEYVGWVGVQYGLGEGEDAQLPFYGIFNVSTGDGFSSAEYREQSLSEEIAREISLAEEQAARLEAKLQEASTQQEMNEAAAELYKTWDDALNSVWKLLEAELDDASMEALRTEEREWIARRDAEVEAAGQENEGGSIQEMVKASAAADLTKVRVYELAEYAK